MPYDLGLERAVGVPVIERGEAGLSEVEGDIGVPDDVATELIAVLEKRLGFLAKQKVVSSSGPSAEAIDA